MKKDRTVERLATDIEAELAEAKRHGTDAMLGTAPPRLIFTRGELEIIAKVLKASVGEDVPGSLQVGGPH